MRYLRVAVNQAPADRHPMHQFLVEHDGYRASRLLQATPPADGAHAMLFHVEGPRHPYEATLADQERVVAYELSECVDDSFYLYVREELDARSAAFVGAFSQPGLVVVMPIEYRADGTIRLTAVGPAGPLQDAVGETPSAMDVDVLEVGEYDARRFDAASDLTDRQFEAVLAAVDCGYYDTPREGRVADVADRLACAPGTAAELLRRAEKRVMRQVVSTGSV